MLAVEHMDSQKEATKTPKQDSSYAAKEKRQKGKAGPARSESGARHGTEKSDGKDIENPT